MPDTTAANPELYSFGRTKDSSRIYYTTDPKTNEPKLAVSNNFKAPVVDVKGAIASFRTEVQKRKGFKESGGELSFFSEGQQNTIDYNITYTDYIGKKDILKKYVRFETYRDSKNKERATRRVPTEWWYEDKLIAFADSKQAEQVIIDECANLMIQLLDQKSKAEADLVALQQDYDEQQSQEVQEVCKLLGISPEDAIAYLAAGGTVAEASKKVADWNLASPSQRKSLIAQDAIDENGERRNYGTEFSLGKAGSAIKYTAKPVDDVFKFRKKYSEKETTKAYIALVKENKVNEESAATTLIKLQEFWMQSVSEVDSEKYQIVETFNKPKIYFFDRRARVYQYSFVLENTGPRNRAANAYNDDGSISSSNQAGDAGFGNPWRDIFKSVYENYLRGTKAVEERVKAVIHYDGLTRIGYVLSCAMSMDAQNDNLAQVQLSVFVEDEKQATNVSVNKSFVDAEDLIIKAQTTALDTAKGPEVVLFKSSTSEDFRSNLVITDRISNFADNNTIASMQKPFRVYIAEKQGEGEPNLVNPVLSYGDVKVDKIEFELEGVDLSKSLLLSIGSSPSNIGVVPGGTFAVSKSGQELMVVLNKANLPSEVYDKLNNKTAVAARYSINLIYQDKISNISGQILFKKNERIVRIKSPGKAQATLKYFNNTYVIEMSTDKLVKTLDLSSIPFADYDSNDTEIEILEGGVPINLSEKDNFIYPGAGVTWENVPTGLPNNADLSVMPFPSVRGELATPSSMKLLLNLREKLDSNQQAEFPGESVKYNGTKTIIKDVPIQFIVNYKRTPNETDWKVIGASTINEPIADAFASTSVLYSRLGIFIESDSEVDQAVLNDFIFSTQFGTSTRNSFNSNFIAPVAVKFDFENNDGKMENIVLSTKARINFASPALAKKKGSEIKNDFKDANVTADKDYYLLSVGYQLVLEKSFFQLKNEEGLRRAIKYRDETKSGKWLDTSILGAALSRINNIDYNVNLLGAEGTFDWKILKTNFKQNVTVKFEDKSKSEMNYAYNLNSGTVNK